MSSRPPDLEPSNTADGGQALLLETIQRIARGQFDALDTLYDLPGGEDISPTVAELAEAIGLILVKLEAREFHIELAMEAEKQLKELNQLKDKYLGIAAHDLRNPLSAIRGMTEMMIDMEVDRETQQSFLSSINRVSNQMLTLINDLLDVSVIESGGFELNLADGCLSEVVEERARIAELRAREKGITLSTDIEKVSTSKFDADRIGQAVDNLLANALKFSEPDTNVRVTCRRFENAMEVAVSDQGPGIPPEELDRLFSAFQTLSNRPTGGEKSTGLGLAIVKQIIDLHGGSIDVDSRMDTGTTFRFRIPILQD